MRRTAAITVIITALTALVWGPVAHAAIVDVPQPHAGLVPEQPALGYPIIRETPLLSATARRQVKASDQAGRFIVAGGDFLEVEDAASGTVVPHRYFAAWNIDTKQLACPGKFSLNAEVLAVEPGLSPTTVFVAGRFTKIAGADGIELARNKVALLDLANCTVDPTFVSQGANGKVNNLERVGNRLFLGGDFQSIAGRPVETVAELNATTGAINPAFSFLTEGEMGNRVLGMRANPDGTRLIVGGRFGTMSGTGGSVPAPTVVIDITDPTAPRLTAHRSSGYVTLADLMDMNISPDGTKMGLVFGTATSSDYVYLTDTTEAPVTYTWRKFMRDSSFGVALSDTALYVSGHFCKIDSGPGASEVMEPRMGIDVCTGTKNYSGGVWRSKLAALSLVDGTPLTWNPGSTAWTGGRDITVTTRGLLVGQDGERNDDKRVGALAFFDLGPGVEDSDPPSDVTFTAPTPGASVKDPARITGTATDDSGIAGYRVSITDGANRWVQPNGTLGAYYEFVVPATASGDLVVEASMPAGAYTARAQAVDARGQRSPNIATLPFVQTGQEGVAPASTIGGPPATVPTETQVDVTGSATDNVAIRSIVAQVRDGGGRYLQDDRRLNTTPNDYPVEITGGALDSPGAGWRLDLGATLPPRSYTVTVTVTDTSDNATTVTTGFAVNTTITTSRYALAGHSSSSNSQANATVGSLFTVDRTTKVAGVGIFDTNGNGVLDNPADTQVGIWDATTRVLLSGATVARTQAPQGGWFYGDFITPLILQPGQTYVVGHRTYSTGERYSTGGSLTATTGVTYTGRAVSGTSTTFQYPTSQSTGVGYGVPNMRFLDEQSTLPQPRITSPTGDVAIGTTATLAATVTDNGTITSVGVRLTDAAGRFLRGDGTFGSGAADLPATVEGWGTGSATASFTTGPLAVGTYTVTVTATDAVGNVGTATFTFSATLAAASTPAVTAYTGFGRSDDNYTVGALVQVASPVRVAAIGIQDANGNGVLDNSSDTPVAIWRQSDQQLVAQGTVARSTPSEGGWFYVSLASPALLQPGTTYVVGHRSYRRGESYASGGTLTTAPGISYVGRARSSSTGNTFAYPTSQSSSVGYGVPNLRLVSTVLPVADPIADRSDPTLSPVSVQAYGADPDGGPVSYAASGLPAGLTIAASTGLITGTPSTVGVSDVTITVTDDEGQTATTAFRWTVTDGTPPPPQDPCTVAARVEGGVLLTWLPVAGVTTNYQVLRNGVWLAGVSPATTSYVHPTGSLADTYVIRHRIGGITTDRPCTRVP